MLCSVCRGEMLPTTALPICWRAKTSQVPQEGVRPSLTVASLACCCSKLTFPQALMAALTWGSDRMQVGIEKQEFGKEFTLQPGFQPGFGGFGPPQKARLGVALQPPTKDQATPPPIAGRRPTARRT